MNPFLQMISAAQTWQEVSLASARLTWSAAQVVQIRAAQMATGTMKPAEAMRMVFEKPAAFAAGMEKVAVAAARSPDLAAMALAGLAPVSSSAKANARRLTRRR